MDTPSPANPGPDLETRVIAWLELRREMENLNARLQYLNLMLRLGVNLP